MLNAKLPYLNAFISERREVAAVYNDLLKDVVQVGLPAVREDAWHTYNQYTIRVRNGKREALMKGLEKMGIPSRIYYPLALHQQAAFGRYAPVGHGLKQAEKACQEVLSLPMHTEMSPEEAAYIARSVAGLLKEL